jgi:hypothetical protein
MYLYKNVVFFTLYTTSISYFITIKTSATSELHKYSCYQGRIQGGGPPPKIGKNMIFGVKS